MKKRIVLVLALAICLTLVLSACGGSAAKLGFGHVVTTSDRSADGNLSAQSNAVFCAATFDSNGKILDIKFDIAQVTTAFADGALVANKNQTKTKRDLGADYGMVANGGATYEWYEQVEAFEKWATGKKADDVINMSTKQGSEGHDHVPDVADLTSTCTIDVGDFLTALQNAYDSAQ